MSKKTAYIVVSRQLSLPQQFHFLFPRIMCTERVYPCLQREGLSSTGHDFTISYASVQNMLPSFAREMPKKKLKELEKR